MLISCNSFELTDEIVQLVYGIFNPAETTCVLLSLISYKKIHSVQILNMQEGDSKAILNSEKRIEELKETKNKMTKLI